MMTKLGRFLMGNQAGASPQCCIATPTHMCRWGNAIGSVCQCLSICQSDHRKKQKARVQFKKNKTLCLHQGMVSFTLEQCDSLNTYESCNKIEEVLLHVQRRAYIGPELQHALITMTHMANTITMCSCIVGTM